MQLLPVRVPFLILVLSGACTIRDAWRLSHGALTLPFYRRLMLERVNEWNLKVERVSKVMRLPGATWLSEWIARKSVAVAG